MITIPISFLIYLGCLIGAVYTSYHSGIKAGVEGCLQSLEKQGIIKREYDEE